MQQKNLLYFADSLVFPFFEYSIFYHQLNQKFNQVMNLMTGSPMQSSNLNLCFCFVYMILSTNFNGDASDFVYLH